MLPTKRSNYLKPRNQGNDWFLGIAGAMTMGILILWLTLRDIVLGRVEAKRLWHRWTGGHGAD